MESRQAQAEAFLQEAVYQSRTEQGSAIAAAGGQCGLGEKAVVNLDLTERGQELARELWPTGLDEESNAALSDVVTKWVERQDTLDRKRNHFMKDFRHKHGFDRAQYTAELSTAWREGLDQVNNESNEERRAAAARLLERVAAGPPATP